MKTKTAAECVQYADDTSIYRHSKPKQLKECADQVNTDINVLQNWSEETNLVFNAKTTKSMPFSTKQMAKHHQFTFEIKSSNGKTIERVTSFKLLGITFDENLRWNIHVSKLHLLIIKRTLN